MKKGTSAVLLLTSAAIISLLGLAAYLTIYIMDDTSDLPTPDAQVLSVPSADTARSVTASAADASPVYGDSDYQEATHCFLFVGDSRTVGMQDAVNEADGTDPCTYIAKVGEGYRWFYNEGISQLEDALADAPDSTVVLNLGVNDLEEISRYVDVYTSLFEAHPKTSFYILSVNPVDEAQCNGAMNEEIKAFNETMRTTFPDRYLDSYTYLLSGDFKTVDGLHYTKDIYRSIHHFVIMILTA